MSSTILTAIVLIISIAVVFIVSRLIKSLFFKLPIYLILLFLVYCFKSSELIITPPRFKTPYAPKKFQMNYSDVEFYTDDDIKIMGWYITGDKNESIILCHPYGMDKGYCILHAKFLNQFGYDILIFDFRAHGKSGGRNCSLGYYEVKDLLAAVSFLKEMGVNKVGVVGFSMGGTVALFGALLSPDIDAVVSEGAYISFHSAVYSFANCYYHVPRYPFLPPAIWTAGIRLGFNPKTLDLNILLQDTLHAPVLIIHSTEDKEIPLSEGLEIYKILKGQKHKWILSDAEHLKYYAKDERKYEEKVIEFFRNSL